MVIENESTSSLDYLMLKFVIYAMAGVSVAGVIDWKGKYPFLSLYKKYDQDTTARNKVKRNKHQKKIKKGNNKTNKTPLSLVFSSSFLPAGMVKGQRTMFFVQRGLLQFCRS